MRLSILGVLILLLQLLPQAVSATEAKEAPASSVAAPAAVPAAPATSKAAPAKPVTSDDNDIAEILGGMGYPELQVVPRASERLKLEAKRESSMWWAMHWPIQVAGLATIYAGSQAKGNRRSGLSEKEIDNASSVASLSTSIGLGWVIGGVVLGVQKPYGNAVKSLGRITGKDERSMLLRERLSEEALERPAKVMRILEHIAVASMVALNGLNLHYSNEKGMVSSGVAIMLSFLPYMFEDQTISVYNKHIEYKKKIYAPIKSVSFNVDTETKAITPVTNLVWRF